MLFFYMNAIFSLRNERVKMQKNGCRLSQRRVLRGLTGVEGRVGQVGPLGQGGRLIIRRLKISRTAEGRRDD